MASLFGFGRRRNDSDIPLSSSSQHDEQPPSTTTSSTTAGPAADDPPVLSSLGPPPTDPTYVISPGGGDHISPLKEDHRQQHLSEAMAVQDNLSIPNIHIFNPAEQQQQQQQHVDEQDHYYANDDGIDNDGDNHDLEADDAGEDYYGQDYNMAGAENYQAVDPKSSMDSYGSYGTAERADTDDQGYYDEYDGYEATTSQNEQLETHAHASGGGYANYDLQEFATASEEEQQQPMPVESHDEEDYPYHAENAEEHEMENNDESGVSSYGVADRRQTSPPVRESWDDGDTGRQYPPNNNNVNNSAGQGLFATSYSTPLSTAPPSALSNRFRTPKTNRDRALFTINTADTSSIQEKPTTPKSPLLEEIFTPQFKEIHTKTVRRRQTRQQNMQDLERRLASITSELANITMDRERDMSCFLRHHVCTPMEQASERIGLERDFGTASSDALIDTGSTTSRQWMSLMARLSRTETDMTKFVHVDIQSLVGDQLDQARNELTQEVIPTFHMEARKSEKREGSMLRAFEAVAGTARRRYHEERAARYAAYEVLRKQLLDEAKMESDPARIEEAIGKVRALRAKLEQERVERRMRDEHLKTAIEQETISMKRALLESSGGDDLIAESGADSVRRAIAYH